MKGGFYEGSDNHIGSIASSFIGGPNFPAGQC
jgi:hypothetical protein